MKKTTICFVLTIGICFFLASNASSQDDCALSIVSYVQHTRAFDTGGLDMVVIKGKRYVVSVGTSTLTDITQKQLNIAYKAASLVADKRIVEFSTSNQIYTKEVYAEDITVIGASPSAKRISEAFYSQEIRQKVTGNISNVIEVEKWYDSSIRTAYVLKSLLID